MTNTTWRDGAARKIGLGRGKVILISYRQFSQTAFTYLKIRTCIMFHLSLYHTQMFFTEDKKSSSGTAKGRSLERTAGIFSADKE